MEKIPRFKLRRLNLDQRRELHKKQTKFERFNQKVHLALDLISRFFFPYPFYRRPLKLLYVHGLATIGTLIIMPPPAETPPFTIPIVFASSFCVAYILTALRIV